MGWIPGGWCVVGCTSRWHVGKVDATLHVGQATGLGPVGLVAVGQIAQQAGVDDGLFIGEQFRIGF